MYKPERATDTNILNHNINPEGLCDDSGKGLKKAL